MRVGAGGPAAELLTLLVDGNGGATESGGTFRLDSAGGVDEYNLAGSSEAEVLPQHRQSALAGFGHNRQEGLDVVNIGQRPVLLIACAGQEAGEVADDGQGRVDGAVGARQRAGPPGPLACSQQGLGKRMYLGSKRERDGLNAALAATGLSTVPVLARVPRPKDPRLLRESFDRRTDTDRGTKGSSSVTVRASHGQSSPFASLVGACRACPDRLTVARQAIPRVLLNWIY